MADNKKEVDHKSGDPPTPKNMDDIIRIMLLLCKGLPGNVVVAGEAFNHIEDLENSYKFFLAVYNASLTEQTRIEFLYSEYKDRFNKDMQRLVDHYLNQ